MRPWRIVPPAAAVVKAADLLDGLIAMRYSTTMLESEIRRVFSVPHAFCVSSGKAALVMVLRALRQLSSRNEVIVPGYTCFSVPASILNAGLKVVPCDIDPQTFDFDYDCLKEKVGDHTLCIVATHLFGISADLDRLTTVCAERDVFLVEDVAQAMGGEYKGRKLGTIGHVGFYSFDRGKNITCGSGGVIVTHNSRIGAVITKCYKNLHETSYWEDARNFIQVFLMSVFCRPWLYWIPAALPFLGLGQTVFERNFPVRRLSSRRAGLLRNWCERLAESNLNRAEIAGDYLKTLRMGTEVRSVPYLRLPVVLESRQARDDLYCRSKQLGLGLGLMYPHPISEIEELKPLFATECFPGAWKLADTLLTLPTHHWVSLNDKKQICALFTVPAPPKVRVGNSLVSPT